MLSLARPGDGWLSSSHFERRFAAHITAGRAPGASPAQVRAGRKRLSQLWDLCDDFVDRRGPGLLATLLPPRTELCLRLRASPLQHALVTAYLGGAAAGDKRACARAGVSAAPWV